MNVSELQVGHVVFSKLLEEKQSRKRLVTSVIQRSCLTRVETERVGDRNRREVFELPSQQPIECEPLRWTDAAIFGHGATRSLWAWLKPESQAERTAA